MAVTEHRDNFNIGAAAKVLGVSVQTLRRWDKSGRLKALRSDANQRYYTRNQLELFLSETRRVKYER